MLKTSSAIVSLLFFMSCHSLNNRHDTLAIECDLGGRTQNKVLLKFTNPGGVELSPEQIAKLQVQYEPESPTELAFTPTSRACVALPMAAARIKANIGGEAPLTAELNLDAKAATGKIHTVILETPGILELGLKCPKDGLLAASTLDNTIEIIKSFGKLSGYMVDLSVYNNANQKVDSLFRKEAQDEGLLLPKTFDLTNLAEGSYKLSLALVDTYHKKINAAARSQCRLTVLRSCARDEDFNIATVSCVPKLCDNTYRIGAKWSEGLALKRGEGRFECQLVNETAQKTMLSHACQGGYFKSSDSCLAATEIAGNCALLENGDVTCWGTQLAKDNYPIRKDINYQTTLRFPEKIRKFAQRCVELESGKVHCWGLTNGDNARYEFLQGRGTPETWQDAIAIGYVEPDQACSDPAATGLACEFQLSDANGVSAIKPDPILRMNQCLVDTKGQLWCYKVAIPNAQSIASTVTAGPFSRVDVLPQLSRQVHAEGLTTCALLVVGQVMCWGDNAAGSVGSNKADIWTINPTFVVDSKGSALKSIKQLASTRDGSSKRTTYALNQDGRVFAWGSNLDGTLANGTPGEDDEGNPIFSRFAVAVIVELKAPVSPSQSAQ